MHESDIKLNQAITTLILEGTCIGGSEFGEIASLLRVITGIDHGARLKGSKTFN